MAHRLAHQRRAKDIEDINEGLITTTRTPAKRERWSRALGIARIPSARHYWQRHAYQSFTGTRREAESALAAFLTDIQRRQRPTSAKVRFGEYAKQRLASREVAGEIEASTLQRYEGIVRDHLLPHLDAIPLAKISVADVRRVLGVWRTAPRRDRKKGALSEKLMYDHFCSS